MPDFDWTRFFNPSAWSFAPQLSQGMLAPQVQNSPNAPVTGGAAPQPFTMPGQSPATPPPIAPPSMPTGGGDGAGGNLIGNLLGKLTNQGGTGDPSGVKQGMTPTQTLTQKVAMNMLQPPQMQAPQMQMAKPAGPVQLQPISNPSPQPWNTNMTGAGNQPFGMLGRYGF